VILPRLSLAVVLFLGLAAPLTARADDAAQFPIIADDGNIIANHSVSQELIVRIEHLKNIVVAGNPAGRVTLYEFYDLNCPYCRRASEDIDELLQSNPVLRLVLVPFPVLGIPSILAARVEYAVNRMASPENAYKLHRARSIRAAAQSTTSAPSPRRRSSVWKASSCARSPTRMRSAR